MTSLSRIVASLSVALLLSSVSAPSIAAQSLRSSIAVNIPFAFENGSHHLPAGRYTISLAADNILFVRGNTDGTNFMFQDDHNIRASEKSKLIFHKLGEHYFLREVWLAGRLTHSVCNKTTIEKQQEIAQNRITPQAPQVAILEAIH